MWTKFRIFQWVLCMAALPLAAILMIYIVIVLRLNGKGNFQ